MEFKSVRRLELTKAFALAHRMGERADTPHDRERFRQIARLIWDSCGEEKSIPKKLPPELEQLASDATFPPAPETGGSNAS